MFSEEKRRKVNKAQNLYLKMEEKITEVLSSIGLNRTEIKIYLDLVINNTSSALEISNRTKIYRANTYDTLRRLVEKGFVKEAIQDNKKVFHAIGPERIKDYVKQKEQEIDSIIPRIKEISNNEAKKEDISVTRGVFAFREALLGLLELNQPINVFGIPTGAIERLGGGFLTEFHKQRIKKKIQMRHIYNQNAAQRIKELNGMEFTQAKHLAKKYDSIVSTNVCGDRIVMFVFNEPVSVIEIKNKDIADAYTNYFELLWTHAMV
jgi:sugar-specific transcriptional regulator TrmB